MRRVLAGLRAARIRPNSGVRIAAAAAGVLFLAACAPVDASTAGPAPETSGIAGSTAPLTTTAAPVTAAPTILPSSVAPATTARRTTPKPPPRPAPKPAPKPAPEPKPSAAPAPSTCDPNYSGQCLKDGIGDYDCSSGSGNGPNYVYGTVRVLGSDPFGLDADDDGLGCERG
jgi:hypothetical protein